MARTVAFLGGLVCGLALATSLMVSHADDVQAEVLQAAAVAHVDPVDLAGAVASTGLDPQVYLRAVGEWPAPTPPPAAVSPRVACIVRVESRGVASAVNPRSGAAGLGQFLPSTWKTTPQGRAGLSVYNPDANRAAITWMISVGRAKEFDAVRFGGC
jgi:hypothetical protein